MSSETRQATKPKTNAGREISSECDREQCYTEVYEAAKVPIYVGDVRQEWCPGCVEDEFGLQIGEYSLTEQVKQYVTTKTVSAFAIGMALTAIVMSVFTV